MSQSAQDAALVPRPGVVVLCARTIGPWPDDSGRRHILVPRGDRVESASRAATPPPLKGGVLFRHNARRNRVIL